jgi:hypothetical protein
MSTISDEELIQLQALFKKYDINGDGKIDRKELLPALKESKESFTHEDAYRVMNELDQSHEGGISFKAFLRIAGRLWDPTTSPPITTLRTQAVVLVSDMPDEVGICADGVSFACHGSTPSRIVVSFLCNNLSLCFTCTEPLT